MSVIAAVSNALTPAAAVDQAVEAEAIVAVVVVVESKTGPDAGLPRTYIFLLSINNLLSNSCTT